MAYLYQGGIHKEYSRALAQTAQLQEQYHRDNDLLPQLHKTVIGNRVEKILPNMFIDIVDIKVLKATASFLVKQFHNGDHLALGHFSSPVPSFYSRAITDPVPVMNLVQFFAKIIDKTKKFNNSIDRNHKQIIEC
jgi:hypothetical protein